MDSIARSCAGGKVDSDAASADRLVRLSLWRRIQVVLSAGLLRSAIARQATLVVVGDGITFLASIVTLMCLARMIPPDVMGTYRQLTYLGAMVAGLLEMGLSATVYRFWNLFGPVQRASYGRTLVLLAVAIGLIGSATLFATAPLFAQWFQNPELRSTLRIFAVYPIATIPLLLVRPILLSQGYSLRATLFETGSALVNIFALLVPLLCGLSFRKALLIWAGVTTARLVFVPVMLAPFIAWRGSLLSRAVLREIWSYVWPLQVSRVPSYMIQYLDKVVTSIYMPPHVFAVYSMGAREIPFVGMIGLSVSNVLIPHLVQDASHKRFGQLSRRWASSCEKSALASYPIAAFCVYHAGAVMALLFSSTYERGSSVFRIFALLTFLRVIEFGSLAKALGQSDIILKSSLVGCGVALAAIVPLVKTLGGVGVALNFLVVNVLIAAYLLFCYTRILGQPLRSFFPWPRLSFIAALAFLSVMAGDWLHRAWRWDARLGLGAIWQMAILLVSALGIYLAGVFLLRRFFHLTAPSAIGAVAVAGTGSPAPTGS
jgi:O-antigen/teichoic acid export membrane protein